MRVLRTIVAALLLSALLCQPALADKRVALVIGNSAYKNVPRLANPVNDAALVAGMFKKAGFDSVTTRLDVNIFELREALRTFGLQARDADMAVIYYAGHGIEMDGNNYLIPTDAALLTDADVLDEAIPLDRVLFAVEPARRLRLIILDACRDNPFAKTMKRTVASRGIGRGLAKVEPSTPNTLIAFAAKASSEASDGGSENGPFAKALVAHLPEPGLDLRLAFGRIRDEVLKNTGYQQEPYIYGSLGGEGVPLVLAKPATTIGTQPNPQDAVRRDYELALQLGTGDAWKAFLGHYPEGFYTELAKGQLNKIAAVGAKVMQEARPDERAKQIEAAKAVAKDALAGLTDSHAGANVASLSPQPQDNHISVADLTKNVQAELRRVGCLAAATPDEDWNAASQRSLSMFNKYSGTNFDAKLASLDALDAIKAKQGRVCPLVCDRGFKTDGDRCVKMTCRNGYRVNDDNECEKIEAKHSVAADQNSKKRITQHKQSEVSLAKPQTPEQISCNKGGCRPVHPGCRLAQITRAVPGGDRSSFTGEVCN